MKYPAKKFADDTGVSEKFAKRILKLLYDKELDAEDLNAVLWRAREWFMKNRMPSLIEKLTDKEIEGLIDQLIVERAMWQSDCPRDVCCAETVEELESAFNSLGSPEAVWFFNALEFKDKKEFKAGDVVRVQIMRTGKWEHPMYGEVKITKKTIKDVVLNFKSKKRGVELAVDENHEPDHKALAWFKELISENDGNDLFADVELTKKGADLLNEGAYKYFSPEIVFSKLDEETGEQQSNLLIGGAFTNRPFFKNMVPLMASEGAAADVKLSDDTLRHALFFSHSSTMKKFLELMAKLVEKDTISASDKTELEQAFNELPEDDRNEEITKAFNEICAKFEEPEAKPEGEAEEKPEEKPEGKVEIEEEAETEEESEEEAKSEVPEGVEGVQANEDGSFEVTDPAKFAESIKGIQTLASKMQRQQTLAACEKAVTPLVFSEKRADRVILPKQKKEIVEFAASLDEKRRATFFSILGKLKAVPAEELGHGKDIEPDITKPETFSESDEVVKYFMEKLSQDLATAQKSAAEYYKGKQK